MVKCTPPPKKKKKKKIPNKSERNETGQDWICRQVYGIILNRYYFNFYIFFNDI